MEKNWKAALVFLCIFLAGGVAGAFVGMRIACSQAKSRHDRLVGGQQPPPHRPIDDWSKRKQKEIVTRLELTPDQQTKTETLFQDAQTDLRQVRERSFQQTAEITDRLEAHIMDLLSPEQRPIFAQLIKEREERQKKAAAERAAAAAARNEHPPKPGELPLPPGKQPPAGPSGGAAPTPAFTDKASTSPSPAAVPAQDAAPVEPSKTP
jgi:Spy/CpxP family protein refolding chaperone